MQPNRPLIVATCPVHADTLMLLKRRCDVEVCETPPSAHALADRAAGADGLLTFMSDRIDACLLDACPKLQVVAGALKGADRIEVDACTSRGVWVTAVPDLLSASTAELAVGLIIAVARRIREGDAAVRACRFAGWRPGLFGIGLEGTAVGIVGYGSLGHAIARRLGAFDCRLAYTDPQLSAIEDMTACPLEELLGKSRIVVLAVPLTAVTYRLIDAEKLALMQTGAVLVNVSRGSTVDEEAIAAALDSGRLAGYGADVFAMEDDCHPQAPSYIPTALLEHPRSVLTPHLGSAVKEVRRAIEMQAAEGILQVLAGQCPEHAINSPRVHSNRKSQAPNRDRADLRAYSTSTET
jgi:phosphonate dehydrogenase